MLHPRDAHALGLGMVYQHFTLVPQMTVAENFLLGRERLPAMIDWGSEHAALDAFMARMPFRLDPRRLVATLAAGEKQKLEILKQLYLGRRFIVLDEPTSVLTPDEADEVLGEMRRLTDARLLTVVLITHKLREVVRFAQDVTILRGGKVVAQTEVVAASEPSLARMMFDEPASAEKTDRPRKAAPRATDPYLELAGIDAVGDRGTPAVIGASLSVRPGEIVGVAGVSGNGQKELVQILAGQRDGTRGSVRVGGHAFRGTRRELERWGVSLLIEEPLANAAVRFHVGNGKPGAAAIRSTSHRNRWIRAEAARVTPVRARADLALRHPRRLGFSAAEHAVRRQHPAHGVGARTCARSAAADHAEPVLWARRCGRRRNSAPDHARPQRWGRRTVNQRGPR